MAGTMGNLLGSLKLYAGILYTVPGFGAERIQASMHVALVVLVPSNNH